jgi:hypothetical protein
MIFLGLITSINNTIGEYSLQEDSIKNA